MQNDWREKHFGIPEGPKRLSDRGTPEPAPMWPWLVLVLLIVSPIAAVGIAYALGKFDPPPPVVVEKEVTTERVVVAAPPPQPVKVERVVAPTVTARPTITQARASELQRIIESRDRGLDLMTRDRAKAAATLSQAQADLASAKARLTSLENNKPSANNSAASYQWSLAYDNAVSAAKNATAAIKRGQSVVDGFDQRMAKAKGEKESAEQELSSHDIEQP